MSDWQDREAKQRTRGSTLSDWVRARVGGILDPIAATMARLGVPPNAITVVGFMMQVGIGALFLLGRIRWGGALLLLVAPLDALDGAVARATDSDGPFGAFLDSTLDRLSDAALILGLAAYQFQQGTLLEVGLLLVALVASLMVSYIRARAESLDIRCCVGLLTRLERVLLIGVLSTLGLATVLAWALAILSVVTVFQRVLHVYQVCSRRQ